VDTPETQRQRALVKHIGVNPGESRPPRFWGGGCGVSMKYYYML